jgi:hypothetical protein
MILSCGRCHAQYDTSGREPGTFVICACGDVLVVPQLEFMEATLMIAKYVQRLAVEEGIKLDAVVPANRWEFQRGSARIGVAFDAKDNSLTVESVIMPLPGDPACRHGLFEKVLELNHRSTGEARFAVSAGDLIVTFTRDITGMDYLEFQSAIASVSRTADDYDDELRGNFLSQMTAPEDGDDEVDLASFKSK